MGGSKQLLTSEVEMSPRGDCPGSWELKTFAASWLFPLPSMTGRKSPLGKEGPTYRSWWHMLVISEQEDHELDTSQEGGTLVSPLCYQRLSGNRLEGSPDLASLYQPLPGSYFSGLPSLTPTQGFGRHSTSCVAGVGGNGAWGSWLGMINGLVLAW